MGDADVFTRVAKLSAFSTAIGSIRRFGPPTVDWNGLSVTSWYFASRSSAGTVPTLLLTPELAHYVGPVPDFGDRLAQVLLGRASSSSIPDLVILC